LFGKVFWWGESILRLLQVVRLGDGLLLIVCGIFAIGLLKVCIGELFYSEYKV
jgi:hypothetical protein